MTEMISELSGEAKWLHKLINKIINTEVFQHCNVETRNIDSNSGNYLGQLYEIDVKGLTKDEEKEVNLFVKQKINVKAQIISVETIYNNENLVYSKLPDVFTNLQSEFNVPKEEQYKFAKVYNDIGDDVIVLENLAKRGFKTYHRMDAITLPYAIIAVRQLAKLHAMSFVLQHKMPEYFKKCKESLKLPVIFNEEWKTYGHKVFDTITKLLSDDAKMTKLRNFESVYIEKLPQYYRADETRICCLTHGDYRINNVMVREVEGVPVEVLPVDYQMMDYGCPIRDLLFFIMTGSTQEFRKKHLNKIKDTYFETVADFLKHFNLDIEDVYPRKEFETSFREYLDFGLMMGLFTSALIFIPEHNKLDVQNCSVVDMSLKIDERGKRRITDLIDDYIEWGYL